MRLGHELEVAFSAALPPDRWQPSIMRGEGDEVHVDLVIDDLGLVRTAAGSWLPVAVDVNGGCVLLYREWVRIDGIETNEVVVWDRAVAYEIVRETARHFATTFDGLVEMMSNEGPGRLETRMNYLARWLEMKERLQRQIEKAEAERDALLISRTAHEQEINDCNVRLRFAAARMDELQRARAQDDDAVEAASRRLIEIDRQIAEQTGRRDMAQKLLGDVDEANGEREGGGQ